MIDKTNKVIQCYVVQNIFNAMLVQNIDRFVHPRINYGDSIIDQFGKLHEFSSRKGKPAHRPH